MRAQTRREDEMKGLERVCGPRPAEKGAKEDRRGTAGSDPRTADRMGSGLRGPRPAEEAREVGDGFLFIGPDPQTAEVKEVEATCEPSPTGRTS